LRTLTTRDAYALVSPYFGNAEYAKPVDEPIGTLTTVDRYALVHRNNSSRGNGAEMTTPVTEYMRTLTTAGHQSLIQPGPRGGRPKVSPGSLKEAEAMVSGCLFRMFLPREVAAGMAFPTDYSWDVLDAKGKPAGPNSVYPATLLAGVSIAAPSAQERTRVGVSGYRSPTSAARCRPRFSRPSRT
jgi:DNA (cytosine-5)-methyltransferase 1